MEFKKNLYTSGRFAHKAGITLKTIHHYDKENILKPSSYSEAGYRLYDDEDFARLQKILTLKFLGFSLDEIKTIVKSDYLENGLKASLSMQQEIIDEKINHLNLVKKTINEAQHMLETKNFLEWDSFINIISVINMEKILLNQYKDSVNLSTRINLHDKFSTNKEGWHSWLFKQLNIGSNMRILELGCGNASLWRRNMDKIPPGCTIVLTDLYEGMVKDAGATVSDSLSCFEFKVMDAQKITFDNDSFDMVIANHMLYHVPDREKVFSEIQRVLKPGGTFYASTIGKNHLQELKDLLTEFQSDLYISKSDFSEAFGLDKGILQLSKWFHNIDIRRYEDALRITEVDPIIHYVCSTSGNTKDLLVKDTLRSFRKFVQKKLKINKEIYITKDSGVFVATKPKYDN